MRKIFLAGIALTAFVVPGWAADMPLKAPAMAPVSTWAGTYIGINGGGAWGRTDTTLIVAPNGYFIPPNDLAVGAAGTGSFNNNGALAGGQIGFLTQFNYLVAGMEASMDWMGVSSSFTNSALYPIQGCVQAAGCAFTLTGTTKTNWLFMLLTRAGVDFGSWYAYATGGLAVADMKYSVAFIDNNTGINATTAATFSQAVPGLAFGGGLEFKLY